MKEKVVVLNAARMNYDGLLDLSVISDNMVVYDSTDPEEMVKRAEGADILVTKEIPVTADMIREFSDSVKLIVEAGTGYNNIAMDAAREKGIMVCNVPAYSSDRVAHTAIMLMLVLSSSVHKQIRMLERGDKSNFMNCLMLSHTEMNGKTLGIIGAGNIGKAVIRIAEAMNMNILVYTRTPRADEGNVHYVSFEEVLKNADYLSLHCPLNDKTRHIINAEAISMMKPTAYIVNTARGALIDEPALIEALQAGKIAGAGLDVQETEPPVEDNPLYTMENVIITPHMGWKGKETRERLIGVVANDVKNYVEGHPINVVS